jgi:hypothetical protein
MSQSRSFPKLVKGLRKLLQAAQEHELELPQLGPFTAALDEALEDLTVLKARQKDLQAKSRQATQDLNDQIACGAEAAMNLKSFVRAVFGRRDDRLAAFEVKPLGRPRGSRNMERKGGSSGYTH